MQLIIILLATVSVLTLLSGFITFLGAKKGSKVKSLWFFVATIFATIWSASICLFQAAAPGSEEIIVWHANWTYISAIFIDVALLAYINWHRKYGKMITAFFFVFGLVLAGFIAYNPGLLYTDVILSKTGNGLVTNIGPFYYTYIAFFCLLIPTVIISLIQRIIYFKSKNKRGGDLVLLIGFGISGTTALIFDLILPLWNWSLIWLGPLAISTTIITFYYSILRYHKLNLSSIWLKVLSYVVIISSVAVVYMVVFSLVFALLFKGSTPSIEVIILNFIMIIIFLLLLPAINEVTSFTRSLITNQEPKNNKDD